jgi:hypothetical protein
MAVAVEVAASPAQVAAGGAFPDRKCDALVDRFEALRDGGIA